MQKKKFNAQKWASNVWRQSAKNWIARTAADHNYRDFLIKLALKKFFKKHKKNLLKGTWVDFGCGEGRETFMLYKMFLSLNIKNQLVGLDFQQEFINKAKSEFKKYNIGFYNKTIERFAHNNKINGASFFFVLQDAPDAEKIIKKTAKILPIGGIFLAIIVHPDFAEILKNKELIKIKKPPKNKSNWEWCGKYPIVEIKKEPFYVPYFHRKISWYINQLNKYGLSLLNYQDIQPNEKLLNNAQKHKLLPFYNHKYNIYWPYISKMPSSFLLVGIKKDK